MSKPQDLPPARDKLLFTPGPLTTSQQVKQSMLCDLGSRDSEFIAVLRQVREKLLGLAGVSQADGYEVVLLQGSGTFAIESVISSAIPPGGKLLAIANGIYGQRIAQIARIHGVETMVLEYREDQLPSLDDLQSALASDPAISDVSVVHCETTSGIMNPVREIGQIVDRYGKRYLVDSMSAFGAVPFDLRECHVDYLVSSANKCLEGVPGCAFVICRRAALLATAGWSRTLSLDLLGQWQGFEADGQFRFTPPTHVLLALDQALDELHAEGGVPGRAARYQANHGTLIAGMRRLGFKAYVPPERQGHIITAFRYPDHPNFDFQQFYDRLHRRGFVIYPGKVTDASCFRIGNIGHIFEDDIRSLLMAIGEVVVEMGVEMPVSL